MTLQAEHTFADLMNLPDDGKLYELVHGQLKEKPMGYLALWVATQIAFLLKQQGDQKGLGWTVAELPLDCFRPISNHGRRPDVVFFNRERMPTPPTEEPVRTVPNLVVEVVSTNDNVMELDDKIEEYLKVGIEVVWIVNPRTRTVRVYLANDKTGYIHHENDTIAADPALPGFSVRVSEFFPKPLAT